MKLTTKIHALTALNCVHEALKNRGLAQTY